MIIEITELNTIPIEKRRTEIVERKGIGHPDTICDLIAEKIAVALTKEYKKRFGKILHFNVDKMLLVAGEALPKFGGGEVIKPILLVFGDRATWKVGEEEVPIEEIAISSAKEWIKNNLRFLDPEKHVKYQVEIKAGSLALREIFKKESEILGSNDTSACVGYAPMSKTELTVLNLERFVNSKEFKKEFPETGEDVKVMGIRNGNELDLTIACAFVDRFIDSEAFYFKRKKEIVSRIEDWVKEKFDWKNVRITLNTLDKEGLGVEGLYLTVTGTSAEAGDSGNVGRGNKVNGVFSLNRPVSSEAAPGKNSVSHIGKIYNYLTFELANKLKSRFEEIEEVYVWMINKIGNPVNQPFLVSVEIIPKEKDVVTKLKPEIQGLIEENLANLKKFCEKLIEPWQFGKL